MMLQRLEGTQEAEFVVDGKPLFMVPPNHQEVKLLEKVLDSVTYDCTEMSESESARAHAHVSA